MQPLARRGEADCDQRMRQINNPFPAGPPKLLSFDVFGTLVETRFGTYAAYRSILDDAGGRGMELRPFWSWSVSYTHLRCSWRAYGPSPMVSR